MNPGNVIVGSHVSIDPAVTERSIQCIFVGDTFLAGIFFVEMNPETFRTLMIF